MLSTDDESIQPSVSTLSLTLFADAPVHSVFEACQVTRLVQPSGDDDDDIALKKKDSSPVTVGDFGSQAVALCALHSRFPDDMFISEESSDALIRDEELCGRVVEAVNRPRGGSSEMSDRDDIIRSIDYGQGLNCSEASAESNRVWALDPIDGTKGFLRGRRRGGQYCVALALLEDGEPVVAVLGCPNLPTTNSTAMPNGHWLDEEIDGADEGLFSSLRGTLFVAAKGSGCYEIPLCEIEDWLGGRVSVGQSSWSRLEVTNSDGSIAAEQGRFCLGVERGFSDPTGTVVEIASRICGPKGIFTDEDGLRDIKNSLRIDGQAKYGLLARGQGEYFLRLPKKGYNDWIWDVAGGYLVLKEAGGTLTDVKGREIDFSQIGGATRHAKLPESVRGIFGTAGGVFHEALVNCYGEVL